jgi:hypothetical protein
VKQIATLQKLLDELAAKAGEEPADPNQPGGEVAADPGTPMVDEQGAEPRPRTVRRPSRARPSEIEPVATGAPEAIAPAAAAAPADDGGGNDPLGFGELPANPPVVAGAGGAQIPFQPPGAAPVFESPEGVAPPVARADPRAWRTDYEAFRANIQVDSTLGVPQVKFRSIRELQAAVDEVGKQEADGSVGEEEIAERAKKFAEVGEFIWETTLVDADVSSGDWTQRLNLAPLPEPLSITFQLQEKDPGNWQSLQTGDRVRFTGRFIDYATGDLIAEIRFPEDQPAPPVKRR